MVSLPMRVSFCFLYDVSVTIWVVDNSKMTMVQLFVETAGIIRSMFSCFKNV